MNPRPTILMALSIALGIASNTQAGKFNKTVSIGDTAPAASGMGVDDKQHELAEYKDAKAVAVIFTCNHCPVAQSYQDRLIALQKEYEPKGLQIVAINVNNNDADKLDKMKERAASKGYNFPYLYDASQKSAVNYGASVTPHVFLLDGQRKIAYMGAVDDNMNASQTKRHYLRDAVEAVLAGKAPPVAETRQVGCGIEYQRR
jgi:peroxiredoxin